MTELTWSSGHDKIAAAYAAGRAPDVLELGSDWVYEFASRNSLLDMTKETDSIRSNYLGWESCRIGDKIYGFPWMLGTRALFYNRTLIQNDSIKTWPELLKAVKRVHRPDIQIYGFGNTKREPHQLYKKILPFFWSNGGDILSKEGDSCIINSYENIEALEFYLKLCQHGLLESQKNLDDKFVEGDIGVVFSGGWLIKKIHEQNPGLDYAIMMFPQPDSIKRSYSFYGGEYLVINRQSSHKEIALKFIRYLVQKENVLKLSAISKVTLPAEKMNEDDPYLLNNRIESTLFAQLNQSRPSPLHRNWVRIENILEDEIEKAVYEKKTVGQALFDARNRIQPLLTSQ
jgi:multiple sugar transport system substrate-binding protein